MLIACWSPKGGSGTTTVAVALALLHARAWPAGAVLADCSGDAPAALGMPEPSGPGLLEWLAADPGVGAEALGRLEVEAGGGLAVLPLSGGDGLPLGPEGPDGPPAARADELAALLNDDARPVVADCGRASATLGRTLAAGAMVSLLVIRPCYLALRRALACPITPSGVVVVADPARSLGPVDIHDVLGVDIRAEVPFEPAVGRAVDAGLLVGRLPRALERSLRSTVVAPPAGAVVVSGSAPNARVRRSGPRWRPMPSAAWPRSGHRGQA
jgi:hypothetical protein